LSGRLNDLNTQLNNVIGQIQKLEISLKGFIVEQNIRNAMGKVNGRCNVLIPYLSNETTARNNLDTIKYHRDELAVEITGVIANTDGFYTAAFLLAPAISLWTQAFLISWKLEKYQDFKNTIWDQPTYVQNKNIFLKLFNEHKRLKPLYEANLKEIPSTLDTVYEVIKNTSGKITGFKESSVKFQKEYTSIDDMKNLFAITYMQYGPPGPFFCSLIKRKWGQREKWTWNVIGIVPNNEFPDPPTIKEAAIKKLELDDLKIKIDNHFILMGNAEKQEIEFNKAIERPFSWGGTTADEILVVLINNKWEKVLIEIRRGSDPDCSKNILFISKELNYTEAISIPSTNSDICYRREKKPGSGSGAWNDWVKVSTTQSKSVYID
jgi:hypothetical protein